MKIEPGILCWIGWGPDTHVNPKERGSIDPRSRRGRVIRPYFKPDFWVVDVEGKEEWAVKSCYIVPIPPDEQETNEEVQDEMHA